MQLDEDGAKCFILLSIGKENKYFINEFVDMLEILTWETYQVFCDWQRITIHVIDLAKVTY